jgi:hypothetical protein
MSCSGLLDDAYPRISARRGQTVDLNIDFYHNGELADPYAIRYVEIYKSQVLPHNLVTTIPVVAVDDEDYPSPVCQEAEDTPEGDCGTEPEASTTTIPGKFHLPYAIPNDFVVPDVYFDVWYYFPTNPCSDGTEDCDIDEAEFDGELLRCCKRFWVFPDEWYCSDNLQTIRFGFEPLDQQFRSPEVRPLEVGLMPLPLYDYNFNLVNPLIPFLRPTITIETQHRELLVDAADCTIGIRQGSYRTNPYVIRYNLDTSLFLRGTYQYYITLRLPDGTTRVSRKFMLAVS